MHRQSPFKKSQRSQVLVAMAGLLLAMLACQKEEPVRPDTLPLKVDTTACLGRAATQNGPSGCRTALAYAQRSGSGSVNGCLVASDAAGTVNRRALSFVDGRITLIDEEAILGQPGGVMNGALFLYTQSGDGSRCSNALPDDPCDDENSCLLKLGPQLIRLQAGITPTINFLDADGACISSRPDSVAQVLLPELCGDALDNDCDGLLDEGFEQLNTPCAPTDGCLSPHVWGCQDDGLGVLCQPRDAEVCDDVDNDCDGLVDNHPLGGSVCDGMCRTNDDCEREAPICDQGRCARCTQNAQCDSGRCNPASGVCVECGSSFDCRNPAAPICREGQCESCATHEECRRETPQFPVCIFGGPDQGQCQDCQADNIFQGCEDLAGRPICLASAASTNEFGRCTPCRSPDDCGGRECAGNGACVGCDQDTHQPCRLQPGTPICGEDAECRRCSLSGECAAVYGAGAGDRRICDAGQCVECASSSDCDGVVGKPICANGACAPCESSAECSAVSPDRPVCVPSGTGDGNAGRCVRRCDHPEEALCTARAGGNRPICDPLTGLCRSCSVGDACPAGLNGMPNVCEADTGRCETCRNADNQGCAADLSSPVCVDNVCRGCQRRADCASVQLADGTPLPYCDDGGGPCHQCRLNLPADCGPNEYCVQPNGPNTARVCGGCLSDLDCPGDLRCAEGGLCLECAQDNHCPNGGCLEGRCVDCVDDGDCGLGLRCHNQACVQCVVDAECPGQGVCVNNECLECRQDQDCIDGVCEAGLCIGCRTALDCPTGSSPHFRACINNACQACDVGNPAHCAGIDPDHEYICQGGKCRFCHRATHDGCPVGQFCNHAETGCFDVCSPMARDAYLGTPTSPGCDPGDAPICALEMDAEIPECRFCYDSRRNRDEVDAGCSEARPRCMGNGARCCEPDRDNVGACDSP